MNSIYYNIILVLLIIIQGVISTSNNDNKNIESSISQELPLVPPVYNNSDTIHEVGAYSPNGTLAPGSWADYYFSVSKLDNGFGIGVYVNMIADNNTLEFLTGDGVSMFLKRGSTPSLTNYDHTTAVQCLDSMDCNSFGECNPKSGTYHVSIYNGGNTTIYYKFNVQIDVFAGNGISCGLVSWITEWIERFLAIMITALVVIVLSFIGCIVACCYCCCKRRKAVHGYHKLPYNVGNIQHDI